MVSAWSMGKGKRSTDYLNMSQSPGPAAYSPSFKNKEPVPSWRYTLLYIICNSIAAALRGSIYERKNTPGPGAYAIANRSGGPKYKFARRILSSSFQGSKIPGPGAYEPNHKVIERPISKRITFGSRTEFSFVGEKIPGPGAYNSSDKALYKPPTAVKIGSSSRNDSLDRYKTVGPGPAAYFSRTERLFRGGKFGKARRKGIYWSSVAPGPGTYGVNSLIGKEGTRPLVLSRRPDTSPRYGDHSPGPGTYEILSKSFVNGFSMGKGKRKETFTVNTVPGPLAYTPNDTIKRKSSPSWTY